MGMVSRSLVLIAGYFLCWQFAALFEVERDLSALYPAAGVLLICISRWGRGYLVAAVFAMLIANWPQSPLPTWTGFHWWHLLRQLVVYGGAGLLAQRFQWLELPLQTRRGTATLILLGAAASTVSALWAVPIFSHYIPVTRDTLFQLFFSFLIGDFGGFLFLVGLISTGIHFYNQAQHALPRQTLARYDAWVLGIAMASIVLLVWVLGTHGLLLRFSYLILLPVIAVASARGLIMALLVALFADLATIFMYRGLDLQAIPIQDFQTLCTMVLIIAMIIGSAVDDEKAARFEAWHDPLTGLLNRRAFEVLATNMIQQGRQSSQQLAVISFDIDHFKSINDEHGHAAGDRVLAAFARECAHVVRSTDLIARLGGEEFVVLLFNSTPNDAMRTAERLRERTKTIKRGHSNQALTASFGVYYLDPIQSPDLQEALRHSDEAMYAAKHGGRDQIVVFQSH